MEVQVKDFSHEGRYGKILYQDTEFYVMICSVMFDHWNIDKYSYDERNNTVEIFPSRAWGLKEVLKVKLS